MTRISPPAQAGVSPLPDDAVLSAPAPAAEPGLDAMPADFAAVLQQAGVAEPAPAPAVAVDKSGGEAKATDEGVDEQAAAQPQPAAAPLALPAMAMLQPEAAARWSQPQPAASAAGGQAQATVEALAAAAQPEALLAQAQPKPGTTPAAAAPAWVEPVAVGDDLKPLPAPALPHALAAQPERLAPEGGEIRLPAAEPARWGEQLRAALGERLQLHSSQGMDRALIRLDPPALGTLEISIRHQAGALAVQLTASNGEVLRQLQHIGDALRHDLSSRHYQQVAVDIREGAPGGFSQGRQGRHDGQPQREPGRALADAAWDGNAVFGLEQA